MHGEAEDEALRYAYQSGSYRAFVSYSHRDAAWGKKIHRALETYNIPKKLVGLTTASGEVPPKLAPIFRDREDLPAGEDLSEEVRGALARSEALIVLCSPDARDSIWVGKEIETFRTLHPGRPILAALIRGEPRAAFPHALDGREPAAADFRKGGDGRRLATLKLVAGLTGLDLDALVQRDAQRQLRRVTAVTLAALAALLVMAALLVAALRAQAEADRQRAEAEGLVEYMLTDLRERLEGVGRPEVMAGVNARAMAYYSQQDLDGLPPESLNRRARILHLMGEDDERAANLDGALAKFAEARRTTAAVLAQRPDDPDAIFAHAQSEYWVGYVAWKKNDRATTGRHWQAYLGSAQKLAAIEPHSARSALELAYANANLCDYYLRDDYDLRAAEGRCTASVKDGKVALARARGKAEVVLELANHHGWLAKYYVRKARLAEASAERDEERRLIAGLIVRDPKNSDYRMRMVWWLMGEARILQLAGQHGAAAKLYGEARDTIDALVANDGVNIVNQQVKAHTLGALAQSQKALGDPAWRATLKAARDVVAGMARMNGDYEVVRRLGAFLDGVEIEKWGEAR